MSTKITESLFTSFAPSKTFRYHRDEAPVTSLDFDDSGQFLISSGADESMQLYDCKSGKHVKSVLSKKYGTHLARFTHNSKNCIYASTKNEHTIRYLSLHDNTYVRYFKGHKALVNSLEVSPTSDMFISTSFDNSVRVWDFRTSNCQGYMTCRNRSICSFDPSGLVFAIGNSDTKEVGLYDCRNYDKDPFIVFDLKKFERDPVTLERSFWNKLDFSNDGRHLLIGTNYQYHYVLDSYEGELVTKLKGHGPFKPRNYPDTGSVSFSPDGRYVFGGSGTNDVLVWDMNQLQSSVPPGKVLNPLKALKGDKATPRMVLFNPKMMMLATADNEVSMWLPDLSEAK
ncbi:WD-repeat containing protein [Saccharomycopsis crataegensis]|uniref:WD-repeat containing protein n=1 Tax=Saccharomycopsis crataegensis TaxID=43959 RepID=A0AAV5QFM1_9ASCO|nr:WD-repeat containing protein [Saccharomycopsis crataegensis]